MALDKKQIIILTILIIVIVILTLTFYQVYRKEKVTLPGKELTKEEVLIQQQLKELEVLRKGTAGKALTQDEIEAQKKELDKLRKESNLPPLSSQEIERQLQELNKLRTQ